MNEDLRGQKLPMAAPPGVAMLQRAAAAMEAAQDLDALRSLVRRLVQAEGATEGEAEGNRRARLVAVRLATVPVLVRVLA